MSKPLLSLRRTSVAPPDFVQLRHPPPLEPTASPKNRRIMTPTYKINDDSPLCKKSEVTASLCLPLSISRVGRGREDHFLPLHTREGGLSSPSHTKGFARRHLSRPTPHQGTPRQARRKKGGRDGRRQSTKERKQARRKERKKGRGL